MSLKVWAKRVKNDMTVLFAAFQHEKTPWYVKARAAVTIGYALSPIDLIPDFIPVLGLLDDLLILPVLIALCMKMMPKKVIETCREEVAAGEFELPVKRWIYSVPVLLIWALILWKLIRIFV